MNLLFLRSNIYCWKLILIVGKKYLEEVIHVRNYFLIDLLSNSDNFMPRSAVKKFFFSLVYRLQFRFALEIEKNESLCNYYD